LAESRHLDHAVVEVDGLPWDVAMLAGSLRCHNPSVQVIGLSGFGVRNLPGAKSSPDV
jgi:hypothetical protein